MRRKRWVVVALIVVAAVPPTAAFAKYIESEPVTASFGTATLLPATSLVASYGVCVPKFGQFDGYREVVLTWTPSVSTIADGYVVFRSLTAGGPYTQIGSVLGGTSITYIDTSVPEFTTYYYVVQATRNLWRSTNSNEVSILRQKTNCK
ncbi:MAG: hypothetical protein ACRD1T_23370 [Acidimicrobiia bacterium]